MKLGGGGARYSRWLGGWFVCEMLCLKLFAHFSSHVISGNETCYTCYLCRVDVHAIFCDAWSKGSRVMALFEILMYQYMYILISSDKAGIGSIFIRFSSSL